MRKGKCLIGCLLVLCMILTACGKTETEIERGTSRGAIDAVTETTEHTETDTETVTEGSKTLPIYEADPTGTDAEAEQERFDSFMDGIFTDLVASDSLSLHFLLEHPEDYGISDDGLDFGSIDATEEFAKECEEYQKTLETFDCSLLTTAQKVYYDRLAYEFDLGIRTESLTCPISTVFSENNGAIPNSNTYYTEYPIVEKKDAERFLELLSAYPDYLEVVKEMAAKEQENNAYPTKDQVDGTVEYLENLETSESHPFVVSFRENLKLAEDITDAERDAYVAQAQEIVDSTVIPAIKDFVTYVQQIPTKEAVGMCEYENGEAYYEYLLQSTLGTDMSVDDLFTYLEEEKDAMISELSTKLMFDSDVETRMEEAFSPYSDPKEILENLKKKAAEHFPEIPETSYTVSELPKETEVDSVLAYYLNPQVDNSDRRVIRINGSNNNDNISLYNVLAHEGYPGHLYQDVYFENSGHYHPLSSLLSYLGYGEGWAVYVASFAYDWLLDDENVSLMYNFDYNYPMLVISIVDIGVNYYGWDVDRVAEYLADNYMDESYADYFYETVASDPCDYLPYSAGYLMIRDVIEELEDTGMSEKDAYAAFLTVGPATFETVRKYLGLTE